MNDSSFKKQPQIQSIALQNSLLEIPEAIIISYIYYSKVIFKINGHWP